MKSSDERFSEGQDSAVQDGLRLVKAFKEIKDPAVRQRIIAEAEKAVREQSEGAS